MGQKPTIQSTQKCKQDSRTLSLQLKDDAIGVKSNWCSTFLSSSGLLAQGEAYNPKLDERNAVVTFRDPKTADVKGGIQDFMLYSLQSLIFVCGVIPKAGPSQQIRNMCTV